MSASDWNNDQWSMFWATAKDLGYKPDDIHRLFGVKSMKEWTGGTFAEAIAALKLGKDGDSAPAAETAPQQVPSPPTPAKQVAAAQFPDVTEEPATERGTLDTAALKDWLEATEAAEEEGRKRLESLAEAPFSVNTFFKTGGGFNCQITVRDVNDRDGMVRFNRICNGLRKIGCYAVDRNGNILTSPAMAVAAAAERRQPSAPQGPAAPMPATGTPPAAPSTAPHATTGGAFEMIDSFKVTAPKGKLQVEFWRTGREYPELRWNLSAEKLLEIAPTVAAAGWTAAHFATIGSEHTLKLKVHWEPSPKNPKWKDITAVELA